MAGVFSTTVASETLDECPMAYKNIEEIVGCITPTRCVENRLRPIYNCKSWENEKWRMKSKSSLICANSFLYVTFLKFAKQAVCIIILVLVWFPKNMRPRRSAGRRPNSKPCCPILPMNWSMPFPLLMPNPYIKITEHRMGLCSQGSVVCSFNTVKKRQKPSPSLIGTA